MGLTDALARCELTEGGRFLNGTGVIVPSSRSSHSRESSTSSTASSSTGAESLDGSDKDVTRLEARLEETQLELERSKAECGRLAQIRDDVEAEVRELTASLFQEAHIMVNAANVKAATSEKALKEARMQVEVLSAEVDALKTLVLTSTPSQPNAHLHPQLSSSLSSNNLNGGSGKSSSTLKMFTSRHRRGASDFDLKYQQQQQGLSEVNSVSAGVALSSSLENNAATTIPAPPDCDERDVDPTLYEELESWRRNPSLSRTSGGLMKRLFEEDADRCLDFPCGPELKARVRKAVEENCVYIEECPSNDANSTCALLNTRRICRYRIKLGEGAASDGEVWYSISSLCRNRITAVCDMLTYLRYIQLGLVKSPMEDIYWEVMKLRKQMTLARLGLL